VLVGTYREVRRALEHTARPRLDTERPASSITQCLTNQLSFGRALGSCTACESHIDIRFDVDAGPTTYHLSEDALGRLLVPGGEKLASSISDELLLRAAEH
jgi:hypothetical protein